MPTIYDQSYWKDIKYFKPSEFTNPEYMDPKLIIMLDDLRGRYGKPLTVTSSYSTSGHSSGSMHYYGRAVDIQDVNLKNNYEILDLYLLAEKISFGGIGLYAFGFPGSWKKPGLHLDTGDQGRRWACHKNSSSYVSIDCNYIKSMFI